MVKLASLVLAYFQHASPLESGQFITALLVKAPLRVVQGSLQYKRSTSPFLASVLTFFLCLQWYTYYVKSLELVRKGLQDGISITGV
jgi:hypothetical protein